MSNVINEAKLMFNRLIDGTCLDNFKTNMSQSKQIETVLKVAAIAAAAGIIAGVITASPIVGVIVGGLAAISAFAYFTHDYHLFKAGMEEVKEIAGEAVKKGKEMAGQAAKFAEAMVNPYKKDR